MWTSENRLKYNRDKLHYPSDLTDDEWSHIEPIIPPAKRGGRKRSVSCIERVAFAHVDCDWYDPVSYCLRGLADRMSPGGLIVLDDYHDYGCARTAVDEFVAARRDFTFELGPKTRAAT